MIFELESVFHDSQTCVLILAYSYFVVVVVLFLKLAPSQRAAAVGNVVKAPEMKVGFGPLQVTLPDFIAKAFMDDDRAAVDEDILSMMDDECYLGKDGTLDECADFDPDHSSSA